MTTLFDNIKIIIADLKASWYFRIWAAMWVLCALFVFISLIVLGARSDEAGREKDWNLWIENATKIEFPSFRIRTLNPAQKISDKICYHGSTHIFTKNCEGYSDQSTCFTVITDGVFAENGNVPDDNARIHCAVNTTGWNFTENMFVAWELEGETQWNKNQELYRALYVAPNNMAWITLAKRWVQPLGFEKKLSDGSKVHGFSVWERDLLYHTTAFHHGYYSISTIIGTFRVDHLEQANAYDGWMALGGVGGFAFFLFILHTIVMAGVGVFLENDSKFLNPSTFGSGYGVVGEESSPILH